MNFLGKTQCYGPKQSRSSVHDPEILYFPVESNFYEGKKVTVGTEHELSILVSSQKFSILARLYLFACIRGESSNFCMDSF